MPALIQTCLLQQTVTLQQLIFEPRGLFIQKCRVSKMFKKTLKECNISVKAITNGQERARPKRRDKEKKIAPGKTRSISSHCCERKQGLRPSLIDEYSFRS